MEQQKGLHSKPLLRCLTHAIVTCLNIFKFSVQIIFYASQERKQGCKTQMQNFLPVFFFFFCFVLATICGMALCAKTAETEANAVIIAEAKTDADAKD